MKDMIYWYDLFYLYIYQDGHDVGVRVSFRRGISKVSQFSHDLIPPPETIPPNIQIKHVRNQQNFLFQKTAKQKKTSTLSILNPQNWL